MMLDLLSETQTGSQPNVIKLQRESHYPGRTETSNVGTPSLVFSLQLSFFHSPEQHKNQALIMPVKYLYLVYAV